MDILRVKIFFNSGSKTLFLGSLVGVFSSVLCVGVRVRSFCSRIACAISLNLLKLFSVSLFCFMFFSSFSRIQTPLFKRSFGLKLR
ncbi:hypothetical protein QAD60_06020 [Helicobacter pylori]|nr:hypothetical protein [Helicobacter pylori]